MEDLCDRAHWRGAVERGLMQDDVSRLEEHVLEHRRAARGRTLAHAAPVVDDRHASRAAAHERDNEAILVVERDHRNPVREDRAGRVILAPVQTILVTLAGDAGLQIQDRARANLGEGIAETIAVQHALEEELLLRFATVEAQGFDHVIVVLWDLTYAGISGRDDCRHLRQRGVGDAGTTVGTRHTDAP